MSIQAAALYATVGVTGASQSVRDLQNVSNQVNKTQGVMAGLGKSAGQMATGAMQVGKGLLRIGEWAAIAAAGAVAASAKIGSSFQATTELIHTQAGAQQAEVDSMRTAIEGLVHSVGTSPQELAAGLYHIESVGVRGAAALDILRASALGAKVGLADMESVTNALTAVWFSGIKGAKSMTDAMAILDGIVGVGNMHLQDLTDSFRSGILGTSATYGVDIRSLGAAIATLTDAGVPANIAATRLNMTLTHMAAPTAAALKVMKSLGLGQFTLAADLRKPDGIFAALQDLHDHLAKVGDIKDGALTPKGAADLSKIFGGSRFGATAMQLLVQMDRVEQKYGLITQRSQTFGQNVQATMQTAGFVWGQFKADIENAALAFSDGFLPALARAGSKFDAFLVGHMSDIRTLGVQLGQWLDHIDWNGVEKGANDFLGVVKSVLDIVSKVPPQIDAAIVSFLALNKVSGGLLGAGVGNIVGGAAKGVESIAAGLLRSLAVKLPGIGGAIAKVTAVHVWVDNMPPGFGTGGGGGAPAAAAGGGEAAAAAGVVTPIIGAGIALDYNTAIAMANKGVAAYEAGRAARNAPPVMYGPPAPPDYSGFANANAREDRNALHADLGALGGKITDDLGGLKDTMKGISAEFMSAAHQLAHPKSPAELIHAAAEITRLISTGHGDATNTENVLKSLRSELSKTHDPKLEASLRADIAKVAGLLPGRQFAADELANAKGILASNESTTKKIVGLQDIERALKDRGLPHAAAGIEAQIQDMKSKVSTAAKNAGVTTADAIRAKKLSMEVTIPITSIAQVTNGDITKTQVTYKKIGGKYVA